MGRGIYVGAIAATPALSFREGPKDQTRNLEIPGSLRVPE